MDIPIKREKLSDRLTILIPPSLKQMISEAEQSLGLDVPEFTRIALKNALDKLNRDKLKAT